MNFVAYPIILIAALRAKTGSFSYYLGHKKYQATIVSTTHMTSLGGFSLLQAAQIANQVSRGAGSVTVRIGSDDCTLTISAS